MNEKKRKCRMCLQKVNKDEIIKTRNGYYCEVCQKKSESHLNIASGIIAGLFIVALILILIWEYNETKKEKEN